MSADRRAGRQGSVLIVALWSMAFLGALALQIGAQATMRLHAARHLADRSSAYQDAWGAFDEALGRIQAASGQPPEPLSGPGYEITDDASRISLSGASLETLTAVIEHLRTLEDDSAERVAAAIVDWRDEDEEAQPNGTESDAKNAPFECVEELLLVRGVSWDLFEKLRDQTTVIGHSAVNLNSSSQEVLESVGMSSSLAQKVVASTRGADAAWGTDDDQPFASVADFPAELKQNMGLSSEEESEASEWASAGIFTVEWSSSFLISARSAASGRGRVREITGVVNSEGDIVAWNER
ncbi:MAG: general secretion pathway protein GspK [Candidatus Omnitrophica bacterium]|nr:general secretion pathway protein GspK [Candidatus Omnitrophota bacterium]